ncbi:DUF6763 family protein [Gammaproteobacteria bacterium AB-CW1]|uniref:DUF6763 family protein n=1 Tax=Natronospira elongata TaxID=3110268 RepID=A0AAP6MLY7_9GAMM|nr:DUF6763 family protein [Gammaproteobacteria bacterium AB-CW1]
MFSDDDAPIPAVIGEWYKDFNGGLFEVVAIDDVDGTIEVQFFDGTVEEVDIDLWTEVAMTTAEPPEDWSGSMDMEREDYGVDLDDGGRGDEYTNPLDLLDSDYRF